MYIFYHDFTKNGVLFTDISVMFFAKIKSRNYTRRFNMKSRNVKQKKFTMLYASLRGQCYCNLVKYQQTFESTVETKVF